MDSLVGQNLDETIPEDVYQAAMLAIFWDLYNSYVVDLKEDGVPFGSDYFCSGIISHLSPKADFSPSRQRQ
jgi:hypothetical protein